MYTLSDYDYNLPEELIAQSASHPPESCKFLIYSKDKQVEDKKFSDLTTLIEPETLIIFNNSKVLKARLVFTPSKIVTIQKESERNR